MRLRAWKWSIPKTAGGPVRFGRELTRTYGLALAVIAALLVSGGLHVHGEIAAQRRHAEIINKAGAQRMLSQRLVALSHEMALAPSKDDFLARRERLRLTLERMRAGHQFLIHGDGVSVAPSQRSDRLKKIYAEAGYDLDGRVRRYLQYFHSLAESTQPSQPGLSAIQADGLTNLLQDLEMAVLAYEQVARDRADKAVLVHALFIMLALAVLLLEAIIVFRPLARRAAGQVEAAESEARQRALLLSSALQIVRIGYWRMVKTQNGFSMTASPELVSLLALPVDSGPELVAALQDGDIDFQPGARLQLYSEMFSGQLGPQSITARFRKPCGTLIDLKVQMAQEHDEDGAVNAVIGVVRDVTQAETARRTLEEQAAQIAEAQRLGQIAGWRSPAGGRAVEVDANAVDLLRLPAGTGHLPWRKLADRCVGNGFRDLLAARADAGRSDQTTSADITVRRGDGTLADMTCRIRARRDATGHMLGFDGTIQDISERKLAERQLEQLAYYDSLTGLPNRVLFLRELTEMCAKRQVSGRLGALVLIDIDNFKEVNDGLGHAAGDELMRKIAAQLRLVAGPGNMVARLGGDEFAILVRNATDVAEVQALCGEMIEQLSQRFELTNCDVKSGASAGVCMIPVDSAESAEALRFADLALYRAKDQGKQRHAFFTPGMSEYLLEKLALSRDLTYAIERNELICFYQPIVRARDGAVTGFEALLRWHHPVRGSVSPLDFIPIAESSHLIADIGAFVIRSACAQLRQWHDAGLGTMEIAINVSAAQLRHGDIEGVIAQALEETGCPPQLLCIELTESVFVSNSDARIERLLARLKAHGIKLALDDFGTGYSSLGYLNRLPFDKLKIDRCFVTGVDHHDDKRRLLSGIIGLARGLDMAVVVEGVETEAEFSVVRALGSDLVQGFYFGRPHPAEQAIGVAADIEVKHRLAATAQPARLDHRPAQKTG